MTRTIVFDSEKKFNRIYTGVVVGAQIAAALYNKENQKPLPFDKQRALARLMRKLKAISHDYQPIDGVPAERKLNLVENEEFPKLELDQTEFELVINLYEKVDWVPSIIDEVVDIIDWFSAADKRE